jgi:hypothetical protein
MAEIKIEKKKPVWPWILGLIVVGIIIALVVMGDDDKEVDERDNPAEVGNYEVDRKTDEVNKVQNENGAERTREGSARNTADAAASGAIANYRQHVNEDQGQMGLEHEYTHQALTKLAIALKSVAEKHNYDINADLDQVKEKGDKIMKDPMSLKHADKIKDAQQSIVKAFRGLQEQKFPNMKGEIEKLDQTVASLNPKTPTMEQKQTVKKFFDQAANLLNNMNNLKNT